MSGGGTAPEPAARPVQGADETSKKKGQDYMVAAKQNGGGLFPFHGRTIALAVAIAAILCAAAGGPLWGQECQWATGSGGAVYYNGGNVGIGTTNPENKLHIEGATVLHFDDWGNDTLIFRGQKSTANQWGEYAIRTSYVGLTFRNTQTGQTLLQLGSGGGTSANTLLNPSGGNVGIGTTAPQYKLAVNGTIGTKEVIVTNTGWADYVFKPTYRLTPLSEVAAYVREQQRLPGMPSEREVEQKGVGLGEMQVKLLAKIEELTLHVIELNEQNQKLQARVAQLEEQSHSRGAESVAAVEGR